MTSTQIIDTLEKSDVRDKKIQQERSNEIMLYINFIYDYTEINGVRETARRLGVSHATLSQIRNNHIEAYNYETIKKFAESISKLGNYEAEKKS